MTRAQALNGDALASAELKKRQDFRKHLRLKQLQKQQADEEAYRATITWTARRGMKGKRATASQALIVRRGIDISSEKVNKLPAGGIVHVVDVATTDDGQQRALVQDVWGKSSGWVTMVGSEGEQMLEPLQSDRPRAQEDDRAGWLLNQDENWLKAQFPHHNHIPGQQELSRPRTRELQQHNRMQRAHVQCNAAGMRTGADAAVGTVFRSAARAVQMSAPMDK